MDLALVFDDFNVFVSLMEKAHEMSMRDYVMIIFKNNT